MPNVGALVMREVRQLKVAEPNPWRSRWLARLGDVHRPGAVIGRMAGSVVLGLATLAARSGPLRVDDVEYEYPVASIRGKQWALTLVCPWRLKNDGQLVVDPDVLDRDESVNAEIVSDALWELIGHTVIDVRNSERNVNDPVFFTEGYVIEVEADTDLDPWTFDLPSKMFVGSATFIDPES